eukprot:1547906-Rhodomonas_salina.1
MVLERGTDGGLQYYQTQSAAAALGCCEIRSTDRAYAATRLYNPFSSSRLRMTGPPLWCYATCLRACYAMSGTDLAYAATSGAPSTVPASAL